MALTVTPAELTATALTLTTAAQPNITSVGTLTTLTVDDITINSSTISDAADLGISSGGVLTLDVAGDIILDAGGGDILLKDDGTDFGLLANSSNNLLIRSAINDADIIFQGYTNGGSTTVTALTLDMSASGAVGIGTSNPAKPLHISSADNQPLRVESTDAYTGIELKDNGSATLPPLVSALSNDFIFYGGHASSRPEMMRLTTGGNGSVQVYGVMSFEPGGPVAINAANGRPNIARSADGEMRIAAGKDTNGYITFHTTTSGSTNVAEKVRIDGNGLVGIQTATEADGTAMTSPLTINGANNGGNIFEAHRTGNSIHRLYMSAGGIAYWDTYGTAPEHRIRIAGSDAIKFGMGTALKYNSGSSPGLGGAGANIKMEGDDSQIIMANNFIHSDNSGYTSFTLRAAYGAVDARAVMNLDSGYIKFRTGTSFTERMRITEGASADSVVIWNNAAVNNSGRNFRVMAYDSDSYFSLGNNNNNSIELKMTNSAASTVFSVDGHNGTVYHAGSISSDRDLKENIENVPDGALARIKALKPRTYSFKEETGRVTDQKTGFIAQEVKEAMPEENIVTGTDGEKNMGVDYNGIIAQLVKAVQELEAEVKALKEA